MSDITIITISAISGAAVIGFMCFVSYWIGRKAQAAANFDALAKARWPTNGADELASDHWGVP